MRLNTFGGMGLLCLAALIAGCTPIHPANTPGANAGEPPSGQVSATGNFTLSQAATITQEGTSDMDTNGSAPGVKEAVRDLSTRTGLGQSAITVVSAEPVVWPDGGLGCPRPGMVYPQVQQDGMRIILEANGQRYEYHSGETRPPFLCESPDAGGGGTPASGENN